MTDFPFSLTPPPPASATGYVWARHSLAYLAHCARRCPLSLLDLAARCGYRKIEKFSRHRAAWNKGQGAIPLTYLDALGLDLPMLQDLIETDQREHAAALLLPRFPTRFTARLIPAIYRHIMLPAGIDEDMAIEVVQSYAVEHGLSCAIFYPGLLSIWIGPDGTVAHESHEPRLIIAAGKLTIVASGDGAGVTSLRPLPPR